MWTNDIILAYRSFYRQGVLGYICGQRSLGKIDVGMGADMRDDRNFD
jgi:hypothetical protein